MHIHLTYRSTYEVHLISEITIVPLKRDPLEKLISISLIICTFMY